ncbi:MAG: hypothetical protein AAF791_06240 [Bacteroidota bacterium]
MLRLPPRFSSTSALFVVGTLILLALPGCDLLPAEEDPADDGYNGLSWASTDDASAPYVAVHADGEMLGVSADPDTGELTGAVLYGPDDEQIVVRMDDTGMPQRLVFEGYIVEFRNVADGQADVAMITPEGDLHVARGVAFTTPFGESVPLSPRSAKAQTDPARAASFAGLGIGIATCTVSATLSFGGAFFSLGVAAPFAAGVVFGCGSAVVGVIAEYQRQHGQNGTVLQDTDDAFNQISARTNFIDCVGRSPLGCIQLALQAIQAAFGEGRITEQQRTELIRQVEAILENGGGAVQVSLTWDTTADIDLWVTDPSGERIYFGNRTSASGGQLDVDDRNGFGPENIFWPIGGAPGGTYAVDVDHWSGASPTNYSVTTVVQGVTRTFTGDVASDETDRVTTFTVVELAPVTPAPQPVPAPQPPPADKPVSAL